MTAATSQSPNEPTLRMHVVVLEVGFSDDTRMIATGSGYTEAAAKQNAVLVARVANRGKTMVGYRNAPPDAFERATSGSK